MVLPLLLVQPLRLERWGSIGYLHLSLNPRRIHKLFEQYKYKKEILIFWFWFWRLGWDERKQDRSEDKSTVLIWYKQQEDGSDFAFGGGGGLVGSFILEPLDFECAILDIQQRRTKWQIKFQAALEGIGIDVELPNWDNKMVQSN